MAICACLGVTCGAANLMVNERPEVTRGQPQESWRTLRIFGLEDIMGVVMAFFGVREARVVLHNG